VLGGPKLSSFKIGGPKLQKIENRGTKTAIKPKTFFPYLSDAQYLFNNNNNNIYLLLNRWCVYSPQHTYTTVLNWSYFNNK
jgi:hypothetical protein